MSSYYFCSQIGSNLGKTWSGKNIRKQKPEAIGVIIDRQLNIDEYLISLCKKAVEK